MNATPKQVADALEKGWLLYAHRCDTCGNECKPMASSAGLLSMACGKCWDAGNRDTRLILTGYLCPQCGTEATGDDETALRCPEKCPHCGYVNRGFEISGRPARAGEYEDWLRRQPWKGQRTAG